MENLPIYNDGIQNIEISGEFQQIMESLYSPAVMISIEKEDFNFLINIALNILDKEKIHIEKPIVSSKMPLIEWGKVIGMYEPYSVFMDAFNILSQYINIFTNKEEIKTEIEHSSKTAKIYCHIFDYAIRNAAGFIYTETEENCCLMFFSHIECLL